MHIVISKQFYMNCAHSLPHLPESCDGTGWFRGDKKQLAGLLRYLEESTTGKHQIDLAI